MGGPASAEDGPPSSVIPDVTAVRDQVVVELVQFTRDLRAAGAEVPSNAAVDAAHALVELGFDDRELVRGGLRAVLVTRHRDQAVFDRLFPPFWKRLRSALGAPGGAGSGEPAPPPVDGSLAPPPADDTSPIDVDESEGADGDADSEADPDETAVLSAGEDALDPDGDLVETADYSPVGSSSAVSVRTGTDGPRGLATDVAALLDALGGLRSRRWEHSGGGLPDGRRALRESFGTGGTVLSIPERARRRDAVRMVFLVDVSRSVIDALDRRFLVEFLRVAVDGSRRGRVFFFDTGLRDVTAPFQAANSREALAALDGAEATWGGGTRIGHALDRLRSDHAGAVDRETTVFVVSDGLERGDVDDLEAGMAWLSRRADAVVWLNPLATSPEYEPLCRGMAVAVPYIDGLFAFGGVDDVRELARQLRLRGPGDRIGYEYDPRRRRSP